MKLLTKWKNNKDGRIKILVHRMPHLEQYALAYEHDLHTVTPIYWITLINDWTLVNES